MSTSTTSITAPFGYAELVHRLGGQPCVLPVPADRGGRLSEIGTIAGLPVWSASAAPREAHRVARLLARRGRLGLLVCDDPASRRVSFAATVAPVRVAVVSTDEPDPLLLRRLTRAGSVERSTPLERAIVLADALDVDAAGRRTFRMLHRLVHRSVAALPGRVPAADRHTWILTQLTRLLFLRFVEAEGWLDDNPRFLATWFDRCLASGRHPERNLLHPLFFGTLNRPMDARSRLARAFGAIPYLNGGLFEPHPVERRCRWHLPTEVWREVFADLVDHIDVTLDHDSDDGRVTPELLGRVFEGVMDPSERRRDGTFFTPPALVREILRQAIACHLAPRLSRREEAVEGALDDPDPEMQRALVGLTVLDPAAGSGAFLVEALRMLHGPGEAVAGRVRLLVTRRLFGVDRHPGAVRICELRLWLEVLRAMRGRGPAGVSPLPNLDAAMRAGDALIDPLHGRSLDAPFARLAAGGQRLLERAHGSAKRGAIASIHRRERQAIALELQAHEARLERRIAELLEQRRTPTLFGEAAAPMRSARLELERLRRERRDVREERRRMIRDTAAPPFAIAAAFAPVLGRRGGFDLVVGNPPWVRAERLSPSMREALSQRYRWWRSGGGASWHHLPDLAVAFVERAFDLLAPGGTLALLLPAKIATTAYAQACRGALAERATLHRVADLADDPRAGFEATTYPLALVATRRPAAPGHMVRLGLAGDAPVESQAAWRGARRWSLVSPEAQRLAERLGLMHPPLSERVRPQLGVKTGANVAFLDPPAALGDYCRLAIRGRDLRPFKVTPSVRLLWPADERGRPWRSLPEAVERHLAAHLGRLSGRSDVHRGPWWSLFRTMAATAPHRVAWRDLAHRLEAAVVVDPAAVPLNTCYVAAMPSAAAAESFAAWLNATPVRALARLGAEPAAGGCARFGARTIGSLPLPPQVLGDPVLAGLAHAARDRDVQAAIDDRATDLLGLSGRDLQLLRDVAADRR